MTKFIGKTEKQREWNQFLQLCGQSIERMQKLLKKRLSTISKELVKKQEDELKKRYSELKEK